MPLRGATAAPDEFVTAIAREVAQHVGPLANSPDVHRRLNVAIAIERAAEFSGSWRLAEPIRTLLASDSPAVVIWGLKAARGIVHRPTTDPKAQPALIDAILKAHARFPDQPAIVIETYGALTRGLTDATFVRAQPAGTLSTVARPLVDAVHKLMADRLQRSANGAVTEPGAEQAGIRLLTSSPILDAMDPPRQVASAQAVMNAADDAARQIAGQNLDRSKQTAYRETVRLAGNGFVVVGSKLNDPALVAAGTNVSRISGAGTPATQIGTAVNGLVAAVTTAIPGVKPPPTPAAPAPATPATQPG